MATRYFALAAGIIYVAVGILGFFPVFRADVPIGAPEVAVDAAHGYLFGLFPVNILHNLVHLAIGVWGIVAYKGLRPSVTFAKGLAIIYGIFAVMGFIPVLQTGFGLVPLHGHDIWLHAGTAIVAAYFGWGRRHRSSIAVPERHYDERPTSVRDRSKSA